MKIKTYEELQELNARIKSVEKKLTTKRKALITTEKKTVKLVNEVKALEDELNNIFKNNEDEFNNVFKNNEDDFNNTI